MRIKHSSCPACQSTRIQHKYDIKDHSVSGEVFPVWICLSCRFMFTQQIPDAATIGPYYRSSAYVSHTDTREGLINRLYHLVRNLTLQSKKKLLVRSTRKSTGSLLDLGCGTGAFLKVMHDAGWQVQGLEPDDAAAKIARERSGLQVDKPEKIHGLNAETFDAITLWHVLEHVHTLTEYLQTMHRLLKKDGVLFIAVPNHTSLDARHYQEAWAAYDVPRHLYHWSPQSMQSMLEKNGFELVEKRPMWFDAFYVSMLSEPYLTEKKNLLKAIWVGLRSNLVTLMNRDRCSSIIYIIRKAI
jgi:SAM-dependent methyltransferase